MMRGLAAVLAAGLMCASGAAYAQQQGSSERLSQCIVMSRSFDLQVNQFNKNDATLGQRRKFIEEDQARINAEYASLNSRRAEIEQLRARQTSEKARLESEVHRLNAEDDALKASADTIERERDQLNADADQLDRERSQLDSLGYEIENLAGSVDRTSQSQVNNYNRLVGDWNAARDRYNANVRRYQSNNDSFNRRVDNHNDRVRRRKEQARQWDVDRNAYNQLGDDIKLKVDAFNSDINSAKAENEKLKSAIAEYNMALEQHNATRTKLVAVQETMERDCYAYSYSSDAVRTYCTGVALVTSFCKAFSS